MNYGDLASIVQLGVGLHVGTAVLQLYSDLGMAPMERQLARMRDLFSSPTGACSSQELREEFNVLEGRYSLFKIDFFKQYRWLTGANSIVALVLAVFLIIITCAAGIAIGPGYEWFAVLAIAVSLVPAPLMLGVLWLDARKRLAPLRELADDLLDRGTKAPST